MMIGNAGELVEVHQDHTLDHITFGSCLKNPSGGAIMDQVAKLQPDLFVWLGDMHVAEIFCTTKTAYPFYDVTASGMDIAHPHSGKFLTKNADFKPVGPPLLDKNFGGIQIEWGANPNLTLELRNSEGKRFHSHSVPLSALQFKP